MARQLHRTYDDPLDLVWLRVAAQLGIRVQRSDEVYASWDGRDTLTLSAPADFDPDDSLAQMIFHELCHALVQGPHARRRVDWGLDNTTDKASALQEHACHRLQAALADQHGLRAFFAVTTDWRDYWDALPGDPLGAGDDPAIPLARAAWPEAVRGPWSHAIQQGLRATAALAAQVREIAPPESLWALTRPLHPLGHALGEPHTRCGGCAWSFREGEVLGCRHFPDAPEVQAHWRGCYRHEPPLTHEDCRTCGACCRQGFHVVGVDEDDPCLVAHPELISTDHGQRVIARPGGFCAALRRPHRAPWTCTIYAERPQACRDFEAGGEHCLTARQRVGLSRC